MKTAEQILKEQGLTDAELAAYAPLLADPRQRAAIENPFNKLETEHAQLTARNAEWEDLLEKKYNPAMRSAEEDAAKARREAADLREQIKIAKEYGYFGQEAEDKAKQALDEKRRQEAANAPRGFDPEDPKFQEFSGRYSRAQGDAIALHDFVSEEYRILNGGSINEYVGADGSRGLVALRKESQAAGKGIDKYAEEKFGWSAKRTELESKRKADYEERLRKEGEERYALKHGANPMTNTPMPSRNPFVATNDRAGKQPWEIPDLKAQRLQRAYQNEIKEQQRVN